MRVRGVGFGAWFYLEKPGGATALGCALVLLSAPLWAAPEADGEAADAPQEESTPDSGAPPPGDAEERDSAPEPADEQVAPSAATCAMPAASSSDVSGACALHCGADELCLRADDGGPLCGPLPARVRAGTDLLVVVIGGAGCTDPVRLVTAGGNQAERLAPPAGAPAGALVPLARMSVRVRRDLAYDAVAIHFARGGAGTLVETTHRVAIDHGRYYLSPGLLVPIVVDGERRIVATRVPGSNERRLRVNEDEAVTLALAINGYPFGGKRRGAAYCCDGRPSGRWASEMFGFQLGGDIAFAKPAERLYAGLLLEPVAGLGIGGGIALVRGDAFEAGYREGTLVEDPATLPVDRAYFARGYVGVTLSSRISTTLFAVTRPGLDL